MYIRFTYNQSCYSFRHQNNFGEDCRRDDKVKLSALTSDEDHSYVVFSTYA